MEKIYATILGIGMMSSVIHMLLILKISSLVNNGSTEFTPKILVDILSNKVNLPENKQYLVKICRYNFMFSIMIFITFICLFVYMTIISP
ncbi:MAG: hypothetical protein IKN18_00310 [Neisseriaceae bacterium]|nr:hypothetical protein [Neisseriaceae bacterium]